MEASASGVEINFVATETVTETAFFAVMILSACSPADQSAKTSFFRRRSRVPAS